MKRVSISMFGFVLASCQVWLDVDSPQCSSDKVCVSTFGEGATCKAGVCERPSRDRTDAGELTPDASNAPALPARWACIREPKKDFISDPDKTVKLRMDVVDIVSMRVPAGLSAQACTPGDVECERPVATDVEPGSDGFLEFELPYGFQGFITVQAPDYIPGLSYDNKPYTENVTTSGPAIITPAVLGVISANSGMSSDPNLGLAFVEIRDCNDAPGDGVRLEKIGEASPFYFDGALPSRDLQATAISNQLGAGREPRAIGGFSGLQSGYATLQATLPETGEIVSRLTVQVRVGHITYVRMRAGY
jgi:hypothetical protein